MRLKLAFYAALPTGSAVLLNFTLAYALHATSPRSFRCDHLIQLGISKGMQRAQIIPYGGNQLIDSSTRTNTAAWLNYHQDAVVTRIENELAKYTKTHPLDGESLQILHYGNGQVRYLHAHPIPPTPLAVSHR